MLKFLTHKLRTHSLNEENVSEKVEERDSGTESDDEAERADSGDFCTDVIMKWNDVTDISMRGEARSTLATREQFTGELHTLNLNWLYSCSRWCNILNLPLYHYQYSHPVPV